MTKTWFSGNFCPRDATCSLDQGELTPSNGPKIRTMTFTGNPPNQTYTGTVQAFKDQEDFYKHFTQPDMWKKCEGQILHISENIAMFSIIGTQYGGDGRTTLGLPDLSNERTPDGDYYIYTEADIGHGR